MKGLAQAMEMTKADKVDAVVALVLLLLLAALGYWPGASGRPVPPEVLAIPAVGYAIHVWLRRAMPTSMEDARGESVAVFNRPPALRLLSGIFALGMAALLGVAVSKAFSAFTDWGYSIGDALLVILAIVIFLGLPFLVSLKVASPYQLRLDLRQRQYSLTAGFILAPKTKHGSTDGGLLYVLRMRGGGYQVRLQLPGSKGGYLLDAHGTEEAARAQAWRLADALALRVESRDWLGAVCQDVR